MLNHREVLEALLAGETLVDLKDDKITRRLEGDSIIDQNSISEDAIALEDWKIKPKTISINGFEVPEPVKEPLPVGKRFFIPNLAVTHPQSTLSSFTFWSGVEADMIWLQRGLIHLTEEAAIEHAKVLLSFTEKQ
jgi:hypothetical protein